MIEYLVEHAGADKVLYGSDQPLMDPRCQIGKIITARINDDDKRKVLGGNAARLLEDMENAGLVSALTARSVLDLRVGIGLTPDSPNYRIGLALPLRFY